VNRGAFTRAEIEENRLRCLERNAIFRERGYDPNDNMDFVFSCALPFTGAVLELGTGKGRFLTAMLPYVDRVVSVDLDGEEQRYARLNAAATGHEDRVRFLLADAFRLPWPPRAFDTVVSVNLLHHISDCEALLGEILRVIRPKGKIVLADFNEKGHKIIADVHANERRIHEQKVFSFAKLQSKLAEQGWRARLAEGLCQTVLVAEPGGV